MASVLALPLPVKNYNPLEDLVKELNPPPALFHDEQMASHGLDFVSFVTPFRFHAKLPHFSLRSH